MPQNYQGQPTRRNTIIESFYLEGPDGKKIVNKDLFDKKAQEIAQKFYTTINKRKPIGVGATQMRKIFDEVKRFDYLLQINEDEWQNQLPYIKMIKSKIRYTVARAMKNDRDANACYEALASFITEGIDQINEPQDYKVFLALFEAVYGFYYEHAPSRS